MDLEKIIYERKSCRKYTQTPVTDEELGKIKEFISNAQTISNVEFNYDILTVDEVKLRTPWKAPYYIAVYSKDKVNVGFVFQQLCLYMQTLDIGNCWVGMGKPKVKKDDFAILISFGKSDEITRNIDEFKRKNMSDIADVDDERLKPAQYAPSAVNGQPWFFKLTENGFDVYQTKYNMLKRAILGMYMDVDIGIAIAHLYIANKDSFEFVINENSDDLDKYNYIGSVKI